MSKFSLLFHDLAHTIQQKDGLELEYKDKIRGRIYHTKKSYFIAKEDGIRKKIKDFGKTTLVWEAQISFKKSTGPNTFLLETHSIKYSDISEEDLKAYLEMNYKNITKLIINPIPLGIIKFIKTPEQK